MIFAPHYYYYDLKHFGNNNNNDNDDHDNNNNYTNTNYNYNSGTGLPHAQGYYDDNDRSTDEGMLRIAPGQ
eukprot:CAMPEP_0170847700 /NCGR_PEP_ID=MMETSP0734-20130129/8932_1 /TAXON_ID=186038 /ORGANISM="Fragilariopsis kerguelensis, Strain L26-C5" /LENGTH=70 /DNA_ID=CAMNT_0011216955 /DNA_START=343 /DNA_END=555 /DNA_ORIENTATION=-